MLLDSLLFGTKVRLITGKKGMDHCLLTCEKLAGMPLKCERFHLISGGSYMDLFSVKCKGITVPYYKEFQMAFSPERLCLRDGSLC